MLIKEEICKIFDVPLGMVDSLSESSFSYIEKQISLLKLEILKAKEEEMK